jgi:2-C-methyl-D-erythritol 4-phosphate cytidylyltransferase
LFALIGKDMKRTIIVTAGGIGKRMGGEIPKQFLLLAGKPVLMHTIERFYQFDNQVQIILTLPNEWKDYWEELCDNLDFSISHEIIDGGKERFHSIQNALQIAHGELIGVHDGVRPLVSISTIEKCFNTAKAKGNAIPVVEVKESLRKLENHSSTALVRSEYRLVQTPQCFTADVLKKAYKQKYHSAITDDASLVESMGIQIHLIDGNDGNIKITTPVDLQLAEILLSSAKL